MSSYLRVLRHQDFRYLFLGQSASAVGDQVVIVAIALYVTQRTGSPTDLGLVLAAQSVPLVALLLFGGVWADRLAKHRIMIATDLVRATLHAVLAALILAGGASVPEMIVIEALFGAARAFFQPAYTGLLPQTIPRALVQDARALSESTANVAILVGPALGTALVLGFGAGEAFAFDAATFLVSAMLLGRVRPCQAGAASARRSVAHELRVGWHEVRSRPWVWVTIAAFAGAVLCAYAQWYALAPVLARNLYGSAGLFGVLESVAGAGAVAGALVGISWRPDRPMLVGLVLTLVWPAQIVAFALATPLAVVIAFSFAAGFGFSLMGVWWETALVRNIPAHALSRVSSYDWMGSLALLPLGFALAGPLAAAFGARAVLGVGAVLAFVLLALALVPRSTRELRGEGPRSLGSAERFASEQRGERPLSPGSAEQIARDIGVEGAGETEIAHVDPLIGVVHERRGV